MSAQVLDAMPSARPRLWTLRGRLGRAEYIVYSLGAVVMVCLMIALASLGMILGGRFGRMMLGIVTVLLVYGALPILMTMLTIRRAHDFNCGGWIAILLLVPFINLMFWFIPGTRDENRYGPAPQEPSTGWKLLAVLLPVALIGGFLATPMQPLEPQDNPAAQPAKPLKPYQP